MITFATTIEKKNVTVTRDTKSVADTRDAV